ncbi:DNA repair exonuclease [Paenibacillus sp. R14(2021)]|uniref:metallophosphoesterase family protein n=1 Tax=Paenibacillus sp. R14(2021) TaxID=2859228 RepID=UPI001C6142C8|nr:DNA repair exonuclease [Paenibacillus sp. R14(2021)]
MGVSFRFIHAADLHVDSPFRGLTEVPTHVREALQMSTFQAVESLVRTAITAEVDFVVIAGDLYDSADRSLRAQLALQKEWQKLHAHSVRLFVIHGNHDHLSGQQAALAWPESVHFFGSDKVERLPAYTKRGELAAYISGISYETRSVMTNLAAGYRAGTDGIYGIALLHGSVDGTVGHDPYAPCKLDELVGAGFHYWALGHIHQRTVLHTYPHVVYSGNTQGRHAKETGAKGCYIVNVSASHETELQFIPLDTVRWIDRPLAIDGMDTEQQLLDQLERAAVAAVLESEGRSLMLRFTLIGRSALHARLEATAVVQELLEGLRERLAVSGWQQEVGLADDAWCWVAGIENEAGALIDLAGLAEEDSFVGELIRGSLQIEGDAAEFKQVIEEALQPLLSHAKLRRLTRSVMEERAEDWFAHAREVAAGLLAAEQADQVADKQGERPAADGGDER